MHLPSSPRASAVVARDGGRGVSYAVDETDAGGRCTLQYSLRAHPGAGAAGTGGAGAAAGAGARVTVRKRRASSDACAELVLRAGRSGDHGAPRAPLPHEPVNEEKRSPRRGPPECTPSVHRRTAPELMS